MSDEEFEEFLCGGCYRDVSEEKVIPVGMNTEDGSILYLCVGCALEAASESGGG